VETTAKGAASLAALGVGYYSDMEELKKSWKSDRTFLPSMELEERERLINGWHKAVERSLKWAE
jgi:glycerol kinase